MIPWLLVACAPDVAPTSLSTLAGDFTWHLEVDEAAEAEGYFSCSYTRHYEGEEDRSVPWLCPDCDEVWRATVGMPESEQDCYEQLSGGPPAALEWLGVGDGTWWRAGENIPLDQGSEIVDDGDTFAVDYLGEWVPFADSDGPSYQLSIVGTATRGTGEGDALHGFQTPDTYTCGWPSRHAPPFDGPWELQRGAIVPDGVFLDRCDEPVRLHDFAGQWVVIDIAAMDCGPCQQMAAEHKPFQDMIGPNVQVITLLVPSLQAPFEPTTRADIDAWAENFGLDTPVLRDRGWGVALGYERFGDAFGFPTTVVVGPDGRIRDQWVGYGGWEWVSDVIDGG